MDIGLPADCRGDLTLIPSHACLAWCVSGVYNFCVKSRELIKLLERDGWILVKTVDSHHQYKHPTKPGKVTVPHPKKDLPEGTARSVLKQAGLK